MTDFKYFLHLKVQYAFLHLTELVLRAPEVYFIILAATGISGKGDVFAYIVLGSGAAVIAIRVALYTTLNWRTETLDAVTNSVQPPPDTALVIVIRNRPVRVTYKPVRLGFFIRLTHLSLDSVAVSNSGLIEEDT